MTAGLGSPGSNYLTSLYRTGPNTGKGDNLLDIFDPHLYDGTTANPSWIGYANPNITTAVGLSIKVQGAYTAGPGTDLFTTITAVDRGGPNDPNGHPTVRLTLANPANTSMTTAHVSCAFGGLIGVESTVFNETSIATVIEGTSPRSSSGVNDQVINYWGANRGSRKATAYMAMGQGSGVGWHYGHWMQECDTFIVMDSPNPSGIGLDVRNNGNWVYSMVMANNSTFAGYALGGAKHAIIKVDSSDQVHVGDLSSPWPHNILFDQGATFGAGLLLPFNVPMSTQINTGAGRQLLRMNASNWMVMGDASSPQPIQFQHNYLGFFGATPVVQQTSSLSTGIGQAGSGSTVFRNTTFNGGSGTDYTIGDVVKALKNYGLLA
jgi:hypothetical protein